MVLLVGDPRIARDHHDFERKEMTGMYVNGMITLILFFGGLCFACGVVYPVFMVFMNKVVYKSKLSVKEILRRI